MRKKLLSLYSISILLLTPMAFGASNVPEDPRGAASISAAVFNPPEVPVARGGAGVGPSDSAVLSDHESDDETLKGLVAEARALGLSRDKDVKNTLRDKRDLHRLERQAEFETRRAAFLAKIGGSGKPEAAGGAALAAAAAARVGGLPAAAAAAIMPIPPAVPAIAVGHEAFYQRFMAGRLEYRPDPGSDARLITLPIRDLLAPWAGTANPLSGTFDLSRCGDTGKYISINIGYKKEHIPANASKFEIWICPKFLVEQELPTTASYLAPIMDKWEAPVGYFWTWGGADTKGDYYDYLLNDISMDNGKNLYEKWTFADAAPPSFYTVHLPPLFEPSREHSVQHFSCNIMSLG